MAASSERSPPPFPDAEAGSGDSGEGDDLFGRASKPVETGTKPLLQSADLFSEPFTDLSSEPLVDISSEPTAGISSNTLADLPSELLADIFSDPPTDIASEPLADISSEPLADISLEPPVDISLEPPTDISTESPVNISSEPLADISGEPPADISSEPLAEISSEPLADISGEPPADISSEPLADISSEPLAEISSEPLAEISSEPLADISSEPLADISSEPLADISSEPLADISSEPLAEISSEPPVKISSEPLADISSEPPADISSEPLADISSEPLADISSEPLAEISSEPPADITTEPLAEISSEPPVKISNEPLADISSEPLADISDEPPADISSEPLAEISSEPLAEISSEPLADISNEPPADITTEPLAEISSEPTVKISSEPLADISGEPPSDTTSDPLADITRDPLADIFSDPLADITSDPLADIFTDPLADVLNESPSKPSANEFSAPPGELTGQSRADTLSEAAADIFSEEGVATSTLSSKANGAQSDDEEQDIFAEASVELSLESPHNDVKTKESTREPVPATPAEPKPVPRTPEEEWEEDESRDTFELNISVTNPEKVGDGMNAYMAYNVSTQTTLPMFCSKAFTVRRRFSDFLGLYEKLSDRHSQNGYAVPPPPEKSVLGMTRLKVGKEDSSSAEFVERRRAALERYLQRVVLHPALIQDPDVREFLEKDELPRAVSTHALSGAGILKMISRATDAVAKMTIKMNESDEWFEEKLQHVELMDQQLRKLHALVDSLVGHRKELSGCTAMFARSVAMLGNAEDNTALSRALSQLAELEDKIEQLQHDQAGCDYFILAELLADYIRLLGVLRGCFDQRIRAWQRWQDAQNALQKRRETEAKLLWANKPEKLQQVKNEISEWEAKVTQYEREFERISVTIRKEVLRFEKEKARDFKNQIIKYLGSLLQSQLQLQKYWEAFLPEAKAIA